MSWFGRNSHGSEPPGGDYVRYVEQLNATAARQAAGQLPLPAARADAAPEDVPGAAPARIPPTQTLQRAAVWMIGAGAGLVLLAILFADFAYVDTFLPGMLLIAAGLAFRKHSGRS